VFEVLIQMGLREAPRPVDKKAPQRLAVYKPADRRLTAMQKNGDIFLGEKWSKH